MDNSSTIIIVAIVTGGFVLGFFIVSRIIDKFQASRSSSSSHSTYDANTNNHWQRNDQSRANEYNDFKRSQEQRYQEWEEDQERRQKDTGSTSIEEEYASILGLRRPVTPSDVKRQYRELLAKYHPDKVNHLGVEFQKIAEEKTRAIIEAYNYFRAKYNFE